MRASRTARGRVTGDTADGCESCWRTWICFLRRRRVASSGVCARNISAWHPQASANVDMFLAQTPEDATRLQDIGARPERVRVSGNLKFDIPAPVTPAIVESVRASIAASGAGPVLVCGSTVDGEETLLLKAFENVLVQHSRAVMILAPRHPERFPAVAALLEQRSVRFCRRSVWNGESLAGGV